MAVDLKFIIDGADRGQPTNLEDFGVTVKLDTAINTRIVSFDNDLVFVGGVYEYLFNNLVDTGGCSLVDVEVQYQCEGVYKRFCSQLLHQRFTMLLFSMRQLEYLIL